jgi:hypothetical protein
MTMLVARSCHRSEDFWVAQRFQRCVKAQAESRALAPEGLRSIITNIEHAIKE